jgi:hypothetical protein
VVSDSQYNVLAGHRCVLEIIWSVISWYLSYHLSFQKHMGMLNFFLCVYIYNVLYYSVFWGPSWPWSQISWIYNYLWNQCLSPLMLWVRISIRTRCTILCDKVCQWLATGGWFSPGPPVSSTNKTNHHDIAEILLKVVLNTIKKPNIFSVLTMLNRKSHYFCDKYISSIFETSLLSVLLKNKLKS